jgi:hypothetical protein
MFSYIFIHFPLTLFPREINLILPQLHLAVTSLHVNTHVISGNASPRHGSPGEKGVSPRHIQRQQGDEDVHKILRICRDFCIMLRYIVGIYTSPPNDTPQLDVHETHRL